LTGSNFTKYNFSSSQGAVTSIPLQVGTGASYEMGYSRPLKYNHFSHTIGVNLNEFNSFAGNGINNYKWDTKYLGVNNSIDYTINLTANFNLVLDAGLNLATIIYGKQEINGAYFNLVNQDEFSGLTFIPYSGVQLKYKLNNLGHLSFGYGISKSLILFNISQEKLTNTTNKILFGIHFNINKK
jgi:hypothetical protein